MEYSRGPSIALPCTNTESHHVQWCSLSQPNCQTSSESRQTQPGMAIPGARVDDVPPALPPPRHNPELDKGVDLAWKWQNEDLPLTRRTLAPIKPQSSLWGSTSQAQLIMDEDEDVEMDMELDSSHHAQPIARPPSQSQFATGTSIPTLTRRPPSSSGINQR